MIQEILGINLLTSYLIKLFSKIVRLQICIIIYVYAHKQLLLPALTREASLFKEEQ